MLFILLHKNICIMDEGYMTMGVMVGSLRWERILMNNALYQQLHSWALKWEDVIGTVRKLALSQKVQDIVVMDSMMEGAMEPGKGRVWAVKMQQWDIKTDVKVMNRSDMVYNNLWGCAKTFLLWWWFPGPWLDLEMEKNLAVLLKFYSRSPGIKNKL